jgi:hypothetical protein
MLDQISDPERLFGTGLTSPESSGSEPTSLRHKMCNKFFFSWYIVGCSMPGHQVSLGGKGEEHMLELDTRKLILVKADIGQYSGDSESDRSV